MATSAGEVEVKLTLNADDFKRMLGESQQGIGQLNSSLETIGETLVAVFSFSKIADFFRNSLQAYADSQLAVAKLVATLGAHGIASEDLVTHLEAQSLALEKLSGIEQVSITNAQAMFVTYGLQGATLDKATKAAVDFTARTGSLEVSTNLLAKAFEGNTTMLKRYGITVDQTLDPAKQFNALLGQISDRFGPVASAQANTFSGQIASLGNSFKHLQEDVGQLLSGPAGSVLKWLKDMVDGLTNAVKWFQQIHDVSGSWAAVLGGVLISAMQTIVLHLVNVLSTIVNLLSRIPLLGSQLGILKNQIDVMKQAVIALGTVEQQTYTQSVTNTKNVIANEKQKQDAFVNSAQTHMDVSTAMNKWIADQNSLGKDAFLQMLKDENQGFQQFVDSLKVQEKDLWKEVGSLTDAFFAGVSQNFAKMVVEGKNFSDSMKALFRSMAESIISYIIQIILKMLALYALEEVVTFGGSSAGSGAAAAASAAASSGFQGYAAQGGMINEPSVITGLKSGTTMIAGEAGPEAIVPMGSGSGGGGSGQGNITINISGQFIDGDSTSWQKLMREKIIPQIRRFTMSSPTGPF